MEIDELTPEEYRRLRESGAAHLLLDVREDVEVAAGNIAGHTHIPLGQLPARVDELAGWREQLIVCQCQHGVRSQRAAHWLRAQGFQRLANLTGGYAAWAGVD